MSIFIESGRICRHHNTFNEEVLYEMVWLDEDACSHVMSLQKMAFDHLNNPEIYQLQPERFIKNQFNEEGRTVGVLVENELVAFQILHFPARASDPYDLSENLGFDLNLPEDELTHVAHLESSAIHPLYIGNALTPKMSNCAMKLAVKLDYHHLCATISPKNYSIISADSGEGIVIRGLKEKYGGKLRYILYKNLKNPLPPEFSQQIHIPITDIKKQQEVLQQGFWGYRVEKTGGELEMVYGKSC